MVTPDSWIWEAQCVESEGGSLLTADMTGDGRNGGSVAVALGLPKTAGVLLLETNDVSRRVGREEP